MKNDSLMVFCLSILMILGFILLLLCFAYPFMLIWNACLVDAISGVNNITFWQAFGIMVLVKFLMHNSNLPTNNKNK